MAEELKVIPIIGPSLDWSGYISEVTQLLGQSPVRGIDASGYKFSELAKFVTSLAEFRAGTAIDPLQTLRNDPTILRSLHFGFLVFASNNTLARLSECSDLKIISARIKRRRLSIVTGTLDVWREAVIACSLPQSDDRELVLIANYWFDFFTRVGFGEIWSNYRRSLNDDKTYRLEFKTS